MPEQPRLLIVVGQVLVDPWMSISLEGQFPTWLRQAAELNVPVRHSHGRRSSSIVQRMDRWHEWLRWHGRGRSLIPRADAALGSRWLDRIPSVTIGNFGNAESVAWQQDLVDVYALQRWKVLGSLSQALTEEFDHVYFTTASSYVRVDRLLEVVNKLPKYGVYAGTRLEDAISGETFASGANRILSRDVAQAVVDNRRRYRNDVMEDVGLGRVVSELGYSLTALPTVNVSDDAALQALPDAELRSNFHYRMTSWLGAKRNDASLMVSLHRRLERLEGVRSGGIDD